MVPITYVNVKSMTKYNKSALQMGCLAHWPLSIFVQFSLFATTIGCLAHWPPSTFAKFSLFVTDQLGFSL